MRQLERLHRRRARYSFTLLLWFTLASSSTGATASSPMRQEAEPVAAAGVALGSMPMTTGCIPCAICCIAPAPATHGFNGRCHGPDAPSWRVHAPHEPLPAGSFATGRLRACLPVRIAYCRWLD